MSLSVKGDTKFPNASMALAQFFTNPRAMVEFAKQVAVYPSSAEAFEDPFFASTPSAIEDSARPLAGDIIATYADIVPTIPDEGRRQRDRPQGDRVRALRRRRRPGGPHGRGDRRPTR